ncbi:DUF2859 domain-containing protein [Cardiobacterium hominis]|uniref:DUF2859 domain-containing protein n=1 Tax=Cardiobacterium hominis TaxID=2718 RepID=UPI0028E54CA4|nr:DUF2859 domain-containing protein [Cardiobacterium hominis]
MSTRYATRLALLMAIAMAMPAVSALQPGTFTQYPLQPSAGAAGIQMTRLAVVDASASSRQWLRGNADYLLAQQIPVMVVHSAAPEVQTLLAEYQGSGLLIGAAPEPPELLDAVLHRLGVEQYPAVIEDGVVWQVRDESVQRPPRSQPETITVPAVEKPQPVLTEGADTEPSAEALALQRELDAMRQGSGTGTGNAAGTVPAAGAGNADGKVPVTGGGVPPSSAAGARGVAGSNGAVIKPQSGNPAVLPGAAPATGSVQ